jgi:hypothetical protein
MPALALKDTKTNMWEPVGDENLLAVVKEEHGYMIALCDKNGIAKTIAQWFAEDKKDQIIRRFQEEQEIEQYFGKLSLPI